jgi:exosortase
VNRSPSAAASNGAEKSQPWLILASVLLAWWISIRMLWNDWEIDSQYSYGFLVPILCMALFHMRWKDRPAQAPEEETGSVVLVAGFGVALALLPLFFEANPEWRVLGVLGAFFAIGFTLALLRLIGGAAWVGHFFFPIVFFLIAVPWPRNAENAIMGWLMQKNTIAVLEMLHWCGFEAMRQGNLISLPTGTVGIEEACSGVRSLQSGIMAAFFLGEVFRFGFFSRGVLVFAAFALALFGNFLRASGLSILASVQGVSAVEKWHDLAGYLILAFTMGGLWTLALSYQRIRSARQGAGSPVGVTALPQMALSPIIQRTALAWIILGVISLGGTEAWYRLHEVRRTEEVEWTIASGTRGTKVQPIADRTRRMLFFPEGFSERFTDNKQHVWQFFYLRWPAGRSAIQAVSIHDPQTCLSSVGMVLVKQLDPQLIEVDGMQIYFRVFLFTDRGRYVLVYHAILADGERAGEGRSSAYAYTLAGRWRAVKEGVRNRGQRLIEAAAWDITDVDQANETLRKFLQSTLIRKDANLQNKP